MGDSEPITIKVVSSIGEIDAAQWDACANPQAELYNPFVAHTFLKCLEDAGCVGPASGWLPAHIVMEADDGTITGCMPCYIKTHSRGEFVFDQGWAEAYHRAGGNYYPKLQCSVPFTPVPGPRILVRPGADAEKRERILVLGAIELARRQSFSSLHLTFLRKPEWERLGRFGLLQRNDQQFHWHNAGYETFDDFLASLASRKRKAVRKERGQAVSAGLAIEHIRGSDIGEAHWDAFYEFYEDTGLRKWGTPYLNRDFFSRLGQEMADNCLLIMAKRDGRYVAGALNMIGGDCLYGRYWGAIEHHACLHFEICYYQAIEYAISYKLARVEAGAQGQHKLARGYEPTTTYSCHWFADPGMEAAVKNYLDDERRFVAREAQALAEFTPFRKDRDRSAGADDDAGQQD